jgi:MFS family permease
LISYTSVLKSNSALSTIGFGVIGRFAYALSPVAVVLAISTLKNSFAIAGLASGAFTLSGALFSPRIGKFADQLGPRKVLPIITIFNCASIIGLILAAKGSTILILVTSILAGASFPNFGSYTRTRWGHTLTSHNELASALALESVLDELGFVVGPGLAGILFALFDARSPLYVGAVLVLIGGLGLAFTTNFQLDHENSPAHKGGLFKIKFFRPLLLSLITLGTVFGGSTVSIVATAKLAGIGKYGGILVSLYALGSLIAGIIYGLQKWKVPIGVRYATTLLVMSISTAPLWIFRSGNLLWITVVIAGCTISPTLIAANSFMKAITPAKRLTESFSFIGASISIGITIGSVVSGWLVNAFGPWNSFFSLTFFSLLSAAIAKFSVAKNREHK